MKSMLQLAISKGMKAHWKTRRSKYGNRKVVKDGESFDSVKEYHQWLCLRDMEKRGTILNLVRQPEFRLEVNGQLICKYRGDFAYTKNQQRIVDDTKGFATPEWRLKFKLAKALFPEITWVTS